MRYAAGLALISYLKIAMYEIFPAFSQRHTWQRLRAACHLINVPQGSHAWSRDYTMLHTAALLVAAWLLLTCLRMIPSNSLESILKLSSLQGEDSNNSQGRRSPSITGKQGLLVHISVLHMLPCCKPHPVAINPCDCMLSCMLQSCTGPVHRAALAQFAKHHFCHPQPT